MKRLVLLTVFIIVAMVAVSQEVQIVDSVLVPDFKLKVVNYALFNNPETDKKGLLPFLSEVIRTEGEPSKNSDATQVFIDELVISYQKYLNSFISIDTVIVNVKELEDNIFKLKKWREDILNNEEERGKVSLLEWESKNKDLEKYLRYYSKIPK